MSRTRSTNPTNTTTKETTNMPSKPKPYTMTEATEADALAALEAITNTGAPRHLDTLDVEAWTEAVAVLEQWVAPSGTPYLHTEFDRMVSELLRLSPQPRVKANARVRKMLADLIARSIDNGGDRLAQVQIGDDVTASPVLVHVVLPEHSRMAQTGAETAVIVWYPDGGYTFTDPDTNEPVTIPSLFKGTPAGIARKFRNATDGDAEFSVLKSAVWTLRRLSAPPADPTGAAIEDEPNRRPPQVCAI